MKKAENKRIERKKLKREKVEKGGSRRRLEKKFEKMK